MYDRVRPSACVDTARRGADLMLMYKQRRIYDDDEDDDDGAKGNGALFHTCRR